MLQLCPKCLRGQIVGVGWLLQIQSYYKSLRDDSRLKWKGLSISGDPARGGWVRSIGWGNCASVDSSVVLVAIVQVCVVLVDGIETVHLVMIGLSCSTRLSWYCGVLHCYWSCAWAAPSLVSGWPWSWTSALDLWSISGAWQSWQQRVDDCQTFVSLDKCEIDISGNRLRDSITDFIPLSEVIWQFYIALMSLVYCVWSVLDIDVSL